MTLKGNNTHILNKNSLICLKKPVIILNNFIFYVKKHACYGLAEALRPLQNAPFCPIERWCFTSCQRQAQILILEIFNIFLRLKFLPSLNLNPPKHSGGNIFQRSHSGSRERPFYCVATYLSKLKYQNIRAGPKKI